jgi:cysteine sulfinate desulfinase/cysteine desulfurase-like protein
VLIAMGLSDDQAASAVRFSLSRDTTREEVLEAVEIVSTAALDLRTQAGT